MKFLAVMFLLSLNVFALAEEPINADSSGLFLSGYDVVSYFINDEPVKGKAQFQTEYKGVTLHFASQANRDAFNEQPENYWPQFAGHCANGLSDGHLVRANPEIYRLIDNKLYLFFSWWGKAQWKYKQQEQIQLANETWQQVLDAAER